MERLAAVVTSSTTETDIAIDGDGVRVLRYGMAEGVRKRVESGDGLASRLEKSPEGGLDRIGVETV